MHFIDNCAYNNLLRKVDPAIKLGLAGMIIILCLLLNSPFVGLLAVIWMMALATWKAAIPFKVFGQILLTEFSFFVLATAGVAVSISFASPLSINAWAFRAGPIWFSSSPELLQDALLIISRVMGCVAAMNFLALTTPVIDLITLADRMNISGTLIDLMNIIYRYIFVLFETMQTMRKSQASRMGYINFRRGISSAGLLISRLFIETYHRSQRLQIALESRGYENGNLNVLRETYSMDRSLVWLGLIAASSLILVWMLL